MARWKLLPKIDELSDENLSSFHPVLRQLFFNRNIKTESEANLYMDSSNNMFHDPFLIFDMDNAIDTILEARKQDKQVFIYGDYDVDGVVATSILWDFLYRKLKMKVLPYIPSRFDEGYGLGEKGMDQIIAKGGSLVITVDCGIKDIELVAKYKQKGLDFIITDHHTLQVNENGEPIVSPQANAVIHPRHPNSKYPFKEICGAAVSWKLICAIYQRLKDELNQFDPEEYIDLVALATITDIMPLVDENRIIVSKGIERIKNTKNIGLRNLLISVGVDFEKIDTYHFGFVIGPRLNAAGRMEHALDAVRLLTTTNHESASEYSEKLNLLNIERQNVTKEILDTAIEMIEKEGNSKKINFVFGEEWPEGVVGLVAGKLQEKYNKPILVASINGDEAVGSARSIANFNVTQAIGEFKDLLNRYGGHAQAAGFSINKKNLELFKKNLEEFADQKISEDDLIKVITIDMEISLSDVKTEIVREINRMKPFGYMNRTPNFVIRNCIIKKKNSLGKSMDHVKLLISDRSGGEKEVIGFGKYKEFEHIQIGESIDIVGQLDNNEWNGFTKTQIKLSEFVISSK